MPLRSIHTKTTGEYLNGERWTVKTVYSNSAMLVNKRASIVIPFDVLIENFTPAYAITIHSSQGLTITEPYTLWIEKYTLFSEEDIWRLIYTACSRAKSANQIGIKNLQQD